MTIGDYFNIAAFAAFLCLSFARKCKLPARVMALCLGAQVLSNYDTINLAFQTIAIPVDVAMALLFGYFAVSLTCQLVIIKTLGFKKYKSVSILSALAALNDIIGIYEFYRFDSMNRYEFASMAIIAAQFVAVWTLRNGFLHVHDASAVRLLGRLRNNIGSDKRKA